MATEITTLMEMITETKNDIRLARTEQQAHYTNIMESVEQLLENWKELRSKFLKFLLAYVKYDFHNN